MRILFVIPIIINIHGHRFEIHTFASGNTQKCIDIVLGIKKLEGVMN